MLQAAWLVLVSAITGCFVSIFVPLIKCKLRLMFDQKRCVDGEWFMAWSGLVDVVLRVLMRDGIVGEPIVTAL